MDVKNYLFGGDGLGEDAINSFTEYVDYPIESAANFRETVYALLRDSEERYETPDVSTLEKWRSALIYAKKELGVDIYTTRSLCGWIKDALA